MIEKNVPLAGSYYPGESIKSDRIASIDNAKFLLISLVVFGHAIEPIIEQFPSIRSLYVFIYSFHMQSFAIVSGLLSSKEGGLESLKKNIYAVFLPFLICQSIFLVLKSIIEGQADFNILYPHCGMWYLLSLFLWRLFLPCAVKIKYLSLISVGCALCCGYVEGFGQFLSASRTIAFFPYFLMGYYLKQYRERIIGILIEKKIAVGILILAAGVAFYYPLAKGWLYHNCSYQQMGHSEWYAFLYRLALLFSGGIISMSFLSVLPHRFCLFSDFGKRTLYIYLIHVFILKSMIVIGFYKVLPHNQQLVLLFLIFLSAAMITISLNGYVQKVSMPFIEPEKYFRNHMPVHTHQ